MTAGVTRASFAAALLSGLLLTHPAKGQGAPAPEIPTSVTAAAALAGVATTEELAKQLANPVAALISMPFQANWDYGIGPADSWRFTMNVQPVIPVSFGREWNLIVRTVVPVVYSDSPVPGGENNFGLSDTVQSFFFSPKAPTASGWIWGVGPVVLWPTSTDRALGTGDTGAGPTALVLKQEHGWTYGALANHIWSFAGPSTSPDVNATFLQPFLNFTTRKHTSWVVNSESTYNWDEGQWTVPVNFMVMQLVKLGQVPLQFVLGYRYYAEKPDGGPDDGLRFGVVFLFPK